MFDTQVVAMVCGFGDSISYDQLVAKITGVRIDKSSRFTDWRRRPLSDEQLAYALADVTHLVPVYKHLLEKLHGDGRGEWVAEEMALLTSTDTYDIHPEDAWKRLKMRVRKPIELAVLQKVAAWREREARERNVPRSRVLKDDAVYEVAQQHPKDEKALARLRTVPKGWEKSGAARALLDAVIAAHAIPREELPKVPHARNLPEGTGAAVELLKVLLRMVSEDHGVAPKVLAAGEDLDRIATEGAKADVPAMHGWRREVFGEPALKLISGRTALKFDKRKVSLIDL
jgi:ribonuclease D